MALIDFAAGYHAGGYYHDLILVVPRDDPIFFSATLAN